MSPEKFLHTKDTQLQNSEDVAAAVRKQDRLNLARKKEILDTTDPEDLSEFQEELEGLLETPNTPEARIDAYLKRLEPIFLNEDPTRRSRNVEFLKPYIYNEFIIKEEDVPESLWRLQRKIAHKEGRDFPEKISHVEKHGEFERIRADQQKSLDRWVDYLTGPDALYPPWFKYFAMKSILGLSEYDKKEQSFSKRTKSTTGLYPDLNAEALTNVYEFLEKQQKKVPVENPIPEPENPHAKEVKPVTDEEFQKIISSENFARYYGFSLEHMTSQRELWPETRGEWREFQKGQEAELVKSLQGKGTGWCTAGTGTAETQLSRGPFHVYYSLDKLGQPTIPRLAIRMEGEEISEVRGVEEDQNVDAFVSPALDEKLTEFGDQGERFNKRSSDMRQLTLIESKVQNDGELSVDELLFLYEITSEITSFRQSGKDPRIAQIRGPRNPREDLQKIYNIGPTEAKRLGETLITIERIDLLLDVLDEFSKDEQKTISRLLQSKPPLHLILPQHLYRFTKLNPAEVAQDLAENGSIGAVLAFYKNFGELNDQYFAEYAVVTGETKSLAHNLEDFSSIHGEAVIDKLLTAGEGDSIVRNLKVFPDIDKQDLVERLINKGTVESLMDNIGEFSDITLDIDRLGAIYLEKLSNGETRLRESIKIFPGEFQLECANVLFEKGHYSHVLNNINYFSKETHKELSRRILESINSTPPTDKNSRKYDMRSIVDCGLTEIDSSVAIELVGLDEGGVVLKNLERFTDITDHQSLVDQIDIAEVARHIDKLKNINQATFEKLLETEPNGSKGYGVNYFYLFLNIDSFVITDYQAIADKLIALNKPAVLIENLDKFQNLSPETAHKLLPTGGYWVARHLDRFPGINQQEVADELIVQNNPKAIVESLANFTEISQDTLEKIITTETHDGFVERMDLLDLSRFDQDALAAKLLEVSWYNVSFSGIRKLDRYKFLTREQIKKLDETDIDKQAEVAKMMADQAAAV